MANLSSAAGAAVLVAWCLSPQTPAEKWREDLKYFARELPKRHKNAFHAMPQAAFDREVARLDADIPALADHQVIVRLAQIAAAIGDGHTRVQIPPSFNFKRYPLNLYWFENDLRVLAARPEYQRALGARVVKIGGMGITEVQTRIRSCIPSAENENEWYVLNMSPGFIVRPEFLHALGIVPAVDRALFTFEDAEGEFTLEIPAVTMPAPVNGVVNLGLVSAAKEQPLFRQKPGEPFWFTHLADSNTTYVNWRQYTSLGRHAQPLFEHIDRVKPARVIVDMRQNGGGDFFEGRKHMVEPIARRPAINQKGKLFVIVGRATFSAALANAIDFRKQTNATLVGEPIGERPNSYSENDEMTLPHSRLVVSYSTRYYKFLDEDVPAVIPDKLIPPSWDDFRGGKDGVMEWILRDSIAPHAPLPSRDRRLRSDHGLAGGGRAVAARLRRW